MKDMHGLGVMRGLCGSVLAAVLLAGCAPVILGGAVVTGVSLSDRRTTGAQIDDKQIEYRVAGRIGDALGDRGHVNVTSYNRQVLLTGEVPNDADRKTAEQLATKVDNVRTVTNELVIAEVSKLSQRSSDALINGRVKAGFIDARDLNSNAFKVVVERGAVYLFGRVTAREADRATDVARHANGATKVVRLFELISEEDLVELQSKTSGNSSSTTASPTADRGTP